MLKCSHTKEIQDVDSNAEGCEECLKVSDSWVHLRICKICGKVGCCDSSKNRHARKHFHETGHKIMHSNYPIYMDETYFKL